MLIPLSLAGTAILFAIALVIFRLWLRTIMAQRNVAESASNYLRGDCRRLQSRDDFLMSLVCERHGYQRAEIDRLYHHYNEFDEILPIEVLRELMSSEAIIKSPSRRPKLLEALPGQPQLLTMR